MKKRTFRGVMASGIIALLLVGISLPTPQVQAQTNISLSEQIQILLAQITALQNKIIAMNPSVCPSIVSDLTIGKSGYEVTALQNYLISKGFIIPAGATGYFGGQTQQALAQFQLANGISPASGNFGPITRGKIQSLCAAMVVPPVVVAPATPTTPPATPTETVTLSGEAFIDRFSVKDGNDTDLEEGDKNAEIMDVSFRVTDGDVKITRFDFGFTPSGANNEKDPWDTFETVSVHQGTKKIAEVDASREKNWREDSPSNGDYLLRISGLNWVVKEDKTVDLVVKVTTSNSIKGTADGEIWNVFVPTNGIRGLDADSATVYAGDTADAVTINIDEAGSTDEILVRRSDSDPDAGVLQVKDDARSGYMKVFAFDIDTDDSKNDIQIRKIPVQLTVSDSTLLTFMRDIRIVIDSKTYTKETTVDGTTGTVTFEFNSNELVIDKGDRVTAVVEVDFKSLANNYEGTTISGQVMASNITAKGSNTLTGGQLAGSATGELHTLVTKGTDVSQTSNERTTTITSVSGSNNDYATFRITVNLSAFGQDVYIPVGTNGVSYQLTDAVGAPLTASGTAVVTSSADERGNYFHISEGNSEEVTLEVTYLPGVPNTVARLQLISINFSDDEVAPTQTWSALPANNYRTPAKAIIN